MQTSLSLVLVIVLALTSSYATYATPAIDVTLLSSRPEMVSNGDMLVRIIPATDISWIAMLNGVDVTSQLRGLESTATFIGRLSGLRAGNNELEVRASDNTVTKLWITNYPATGPLFSGPQQHPFICQTEANGLGPPLDANCSGPTVVKYYYKTSEQPDRNKPKAIRLSPEGDEEYSPGFKIYSLIDPPQPEAVARTTTSDGKTVPYIVRRELGTINRAVYDIQFLHQPNTPLPSPWNNWSSWNGRLVYQLGGGCNGGYHQGILEPSGRKQEPFVSQGYAVATATLNLFTVTCNDRLSAETLSMVKEHFIKSYGLPAYTIGVGSSGGAIQAHLIAQNYPGLLDGIIAKMSYPDVVTMVQSFADCRLLERAFNASARQWSEEQKTIVSGFASWTTCIEEPRLKFIEPQDCHPSIPQNLIYNADLNPMGARCDVFSNAINVFGHSPQPGLPYRPLDNVGVQYGLKALNSGKISFDQFIELNKNIGGFDQDGNIVATRTYASLTALRNAYSRGIVLTGAGGLSEIPIVDWRAYMDDLGDGHDSFRSFQTRTRLMAANGRADNQAIIISPRLNTLRSYRYDYPEFAEQDRHLTHAMDQWLAEIKKDGSSASRADKIAMHKPRDLADGCWAASGERIMEMAKPGGLGRCGRLYPSHGDARVGAGAPPSGDTLKCALKPVSASDYRLMLGEKQLERLKTIFPSGVCDYSKPGVGQQTLIDVWQRFDNVGPLEPTK
jgi:hypothetical protein